MRDVDLTGDDWGVLLTRREPSARESCVLVEEEPMSMYLPNSDLRPTGYEPGEFIDIPAMADDPARVDARLPANNAPRARLTDESRSDITRLTLEYISRLVQENRGDRDDIRTIIRNLHAAVVS